MKTQDHMWTDPPADELIQRHRIGTTGGSGARVFSQAMMMSATGGNRSMGGAGSESPRQLSPRPNFPMRRAGSLGPDDAAVRAAAASARDYVFSLHQNYKSALLYGKNNVVVQPANCAQPLRGYLSLQQHATGSLNVRWTPNELMHSDSEPSSAAPFDGGGTGRNGEYISGDKSFLWNCAINLSLDEIVYLHVHQKADSGGSIVFVGADGVQHPPIQFPAGQHPLAFLACLENGLLPWSQLDPPLWLQKGKGKVFPPLRRKSSMFAHRTPLQSPAAQVVEVPEPPASPTGNGVELSPTEPVSEKKTPNAALQQQADYVFRIIPSVGKSFHIDPTTNHVRSPAMLRRIKDTQPASTGSVISLTNFSVRLKERFQTLSASPSRDTTPISGTDGGTTPASVVSRSPPVSPPPGTIPAVDGLAVESVGSSRAVSPKPDDRLEIVCKSMKRQILCRAFYGWLAHSRHLRTVRTHLACLIYLKPVSSVEPTDATGGLTEEAWHALKEQRNDESQRELCRLVYFGGIANDEVRREAWPFLLGWHHLRDTAAVCTDREKTLATKYESTISTWSAVEAIVREKDIEAFRAARCSRTDSQYAEIPLVGPTSFSGSTEKVFDSDGDEDERSNETAERENRVRSARSSEGAERRVSADSAASGKARHAGKMFFVDSGRSTPEHGDGGLYSSELVETFALNLHRIEKDVHRCDRNHEYFAEQRNLDKMKNLMCSYVWEHLDLGYIQGMVDLAAPFLALYDDEVHAYGCFVKLMERMAGNFPHGGQMDAHFANMRALMQVLDPELFELMHQNGDCTHFYFCYRWFLLDFKRELTYGDVSRVWETIWAARTISSAQFGLFFALALLQSYRDVLLENVFDFTDIIKFFNEMAEKHNATTTLAMARDLVDQLQTLIESNAR